MPRLKFHIVGFADPWIAYPKNEIYQEYSIKNKFFVTIKTIIKEYFFSSYNHLIVELPHVKEALSNNNLLSNQKISIVTRKPQTTRWSVNGIKTSENYQIVFIDTPGLQVNPKLALNRYMNKEVSNSLIFTTMTFIIFNWTKYFFTKQPILFRLI